MISHDDATGRLLDAALEHVAFDGWSEQTFQAAVSQCGMTMEAARLSCPRGAVGLALAYHARGDAEMVRRLEAADLLSMRFRDRIAAGVRFRIESIDDKEAVRRGTTLFALPHHAADGARAMWETGVGVWTRLSTSSDAINR